MEFSEFVSVKPFFRVFRLCFKTNSLKCEIAKLSVDFMLLVQLLISYCFFLLIKKEPSCLWHLTLIEALIAKWSSVSMS